ncbi:MAG: Gfo/Idh/MocA family oxidoreductase [Planctomycetes bacterium]|nr:Gfo/Idh/MocA family oxidoreductase [Planctomycetota bacterium]
MFTKNTVDRRGFLATAATIVPAIAVGRDARPAPSERISIGVIGLGSRGFNLLDEFLGQVDAQIVAVCDVDSFHYRDNPWGKGRAFGRKAGQQTVDKHYAKEKSGTITGAVRAYSDFREVCVRDDIDAVIVATPDHWHALCTLEALRAGKDVYCEKPVTHFFHEGQRVYREVAARKAVFQTGSQQRSDQLFRHAAKLVINGHIGKVQHVEVGLPPGYDKPMGDGTVQQPPDSIDYDMWCGPSPKLPYMRARHHRWWRGHRAFGGGVLMDWIGHHNDITHWALGMDRSGPSKVEAVGWTIPETSVYNTPHQYEIQCAYEGGVTTSIASRHAIGSKIIGADGWVYVRRGKLDASDPRLAKLEFNCGPKKVYQSTNHARNFLDCVRSRKECVAPAETAHRSITPGHLGYISQALGRALRWDSKHEQVVGDDEANKLLVSGEYRKPWKLNG